LGQEGTGAGLAEARGEGEGSSLKPKRGKKPYRGRKKLKLRSSDPATSKGPLFTATKKACRNRERGIDQKNEFLAKKKEPEKRAGRAEKARRKRLSSLGG